MGAGGDKNFGAYLDSLGLGKEQVKSESLSNEDARKRADAVVERVMKQRGKAK